MALTYRRPPSWKLPLAIVVILAVLALAGAVVAYDAIDDEARQEVSATPPAPKQTKAPADAKDGAAARRRAASEGAAEKRAADRKNAADRRTADRKAAERKAAERKAAERGAAERRAAERKAAAAAPAGGGGLVRRGKLYSWPRSLDAFTVVLLSAEDRPSAIAFANGVADRKSAKTGVIRSDDFETLPKGFFIVFAGVYDSRAKADRAVTRLSGRYPGAFPQLVKR